MNTKEQIIELWNKLNVTSVDFNFSCGGDSMNDTDITINTKNGTITNNEIETFIDNEVYNRVEFYVNSDGHYQGEFGSVEITLEDEGEGEDFVYNKSSQSEWNEQFTDKVKVELTDTEIKFIGENILQIVGEDSRIDFIYKEDIFLTDEAEQFVADLHKKIENEIANNEPSIDEGELQDYNNFNTEDEIVINVDNELEIEVRYSVTIYRDSID
jgi:hypothetical protein